MQVGFVGLGKMGRPMTLRLRPYLASGYLREARTVEKLARSIGVEAPGLEDTVRRMAADGVDRALAFVTSAYSSYSGCRQYREDIDRARASAGASAPVIDKLRPFHNHPGFVEANAAGQRFGMGHSGCGRSGGWRHRSAAA